MESGSNVRFPRLEPLRAITKAAALGFVESRPVVQGAFLLRFLAGSTFSGGLLDFWVWAWAASWMCATWAVYLFNGVTDVAEDRANASMRPIARGLLGIRTALFVVGLLSALSVLLSLATRYSAWWATLALLALGWAYSAAPLRLKRWPLGLVSVATPAALLTYYAGFTAGGGAALSRDTALLTFAVFMALWMVLVGQTKDLSDVAGDALAGRHSLPVVWGERVARLAFSGTAIILGIAFFFTAVFITPVLLAPATIIVVGAAMLTMAMLGKRGNGSKAKGRAPYRFFMGTQYAAHLAIIGL